MRHALLILIALTTGLLMLSPVGASAQIGWLNPEGKQGVHFEFTTASFDEYGELPGVDFPTGAYIVSGRARLGRTVDWMFELPLFYTRSSWYTYYETSSRSKFGIANPYLGIELGRQGSSAIGIIGIRLPVISREQSFYALPVQWVTPHRFMAYINKVIQFSAAGGYRFVDPAGFGLRVTGGGQFGVPDKGDPELYGDFVFTFWFQSDIFRIGTGVSSLILLTESGIDFGDRLLMTTNLFTDFRGGNWSSGAHLQLPVGENLTDGVNLIYGIHFSYFFPVEGE